MAAPYEPDKNYYVSRVLMPKVHASFGEARSAHDLTERDLFVVTERNWNTYSEKIQLFVMEQRDRFLRKFCWRDENSPENNATYHDINRYEKWRDHSKLIWKDFSDLVSTYHYICSECDTVIHINPNHPDLGESGNQRSIRYRKEFIFECELYAERLNEFRDNFKKKLAELLSKETAISTEQSDVTTLTIDADPVVRTRELAMDAERETKEICENVCFLFDTLKKDLEGAPKHLVDYLVSQRNIFDKTLGKPLMDYIDTWEDALDISTIPKDWYEQLDKFKAKFKAFARKFILDFRNRILSAAEETDTVEETMTTTKSATTGFTKIIKKDWKFKRPDLAT